MRLHPSARLVCIAGLSAALSGTTEFRRALVTHVGSVVCPSTPNRASNSWVPDSSYRACCETQSGDGAGYTATLTSARGPKGTAILACCPKSWSCTGRAPFMSDWTVDKDGAIKFLPSTSPPTYPPTPTALMATDGPRNTSNTAVGSPGFGDGLLPISEIITLAIAGIGLCVAAVTLVYTYKSYKESTRRLWHRFRRAWPWSRRVWR